MCYLDPTKSTLTANEIYQLRTSYGSTQML